MLAASNAAHPLQGYMLPGERTVMQPPAVSGKECIIHRRMRVGKFTNW
jgi:hypothetical protein